MKNRIVGIVVLLLITLIAWPILFKDEVVEKIDVKPTLAQPSTAQLAFDSDISEEDDLFEEPDIAAAEEAMENDEEVPPLNDAKVAPRSVDTTLVEDTKVSSPKRGQQDSQSSPLSWVLQVASYTETSRAKALVKKLNAQNHKAFYRSVITSKGERFRVYVGPSLDKAALEQEKSQVDRSFKVKSMLVRYQPAGADEG